MADLYSSQDSPILVGRCPSGRLVVHWSALDNSTVDRSAHQYASEFANCDRATHDGHLDGLTSIINMWIYSIGFTCIVTSVFIHFSCCNLFLRYVSRLVRMSVLFSIIRIIHGNPRLLKFTYACVAFFAACWVILIIEKVVQCSNPSWHHQLVMSGKPFCLVKAPISIFEFSS